MKFNLGNRRLFQQEFGLVDQINDVLRKSAEKHGIELRADAFVELHEDSRRVSGIGKQPELVPLA